MRASLPFSILAAFPSSLLLVYLAMHVTEGWQLLVVLGFLMVFVVSWFKHSRVGLAVGYFVTAALSLWVAWVNL